MPNDVRSPPPSGGHMRDTSLADALSERYLAYAMSTITANAFSISLLSRNADDGFPTPGKLISKGLRVHAFGDRTAVRVVVVMSWDMFSLSSVVDDMARPLPLRGSSAGLLAIRRHIRRIIGLIVEDTRPTPPQDALQQIGPGKAGETANDLASNTPARANNEGHPRNQRRRRPLHRPRVKPTPRRIRSHMRPYKLRPPITASRIGAHMHNPARNPLAAAIHRPKAIRDPGPPGITFRVPSLPIAIISDGRAQASRVHRHSLSHGEYP